MTMRRGWKTRLMEAVYEVIEWLFVIAVVSAVIALLTYVATITFSSAFSVCG